MACNSPNVPFVLPMWLSIIGKYSHTAKIGGSFHIYGLRSISVQNSLSSPQTMRVWLFRPFIQEVPV